MNKLRKTTAIVLAIMMLASVMALTASGDGSETVTVSLRIEGVDEMMYYNEEIKLEAGASIADLMEALNGIDGAPEVVITEAGYVSEIGGLTDGDYGGWSGWSFHLNDVSLTSGISDYVLHEGDMVVCFYGDPWGIPGMQYPVPDISRLFSESVIAFTSIDTTYDDEFNEVLEENPVAGALVTFNGAEYTTDENGEIVIADKTGISGFRSLQIGKYDEETGLPTVLRFSPDFLLYVPFADMLDNPWYEEAVFFCVLEWSFKGADSEANLFQPLRKMNMAELVRILALVAGGEFEAETDPWYQGELEWALENGIITIDEFDADGYVEKERFIYLFYLTIESVGDSDMTVREDISDAVDYDDITQDYIEAISWAVASGLVQGSSVEERVIEPHEIFTRAMVCQLIYNYFG